MIKIHNPVMFCCQPPCLNAKHCHTPHVIKIQHIHAPTMVVQFERSKDRQACPYDLMPDTARAIVEVLDDYEHSIKKIGYLHHMLRDILCPIHPKILQKTQEIKRPTDI